MLNELADVRATLYADSGFQGMQGMGLPVEGRVIERGRRNHPLPRRHREINRMGTGIRLKVESTISRRKKNQIAAQAYRHRDADYDRTMNLVAGLVNRRAIHRIGQRTSVEF